MLVRILAVATDPSLVARLDRHLNRRGVHLSVVGGPDDLWERLAEESHDLLIIADDAVPDLGRDVLSAIGELPESPDVVVVQGADDAEARAMLLAGGALAVVSSRLAEATLAEALDALIERRRDALLERLRAEESEESRLGDFATRSAAMAELMRIARRVASSDTSLLILGETGVGKEWLARAIHAEGPKAASPFVAVNCAAIPETLMEGELFGHEKGAFTDAVRSRRGYFELAHRGTLFLDEIAEMPAHLQAKLLRALQDRAIYRLGGEKPIAIDVRVMAATNQDPEAAIEAGTFRRDLYYRLGVVTLTVPPLRDRPEDIPVLAEAYRQEFCQQLARHVDRFTPAAMRSLTAYSWPGNVRELSNVVERAVLLCGTDEIGVADLPAGIDRATRRAPGPAPVPFQPAELNLRLGDGWTSRPLRELRTAAVDAAENAYLRRVLEETRGRVGEAAERAGINPRSLYDKMKRLGLRKEDFKDGAG